MKLRTALLLTALVPTPALANYCAAPLSRTNSSIAGVVNTYYPVTANITNGNTITIGGARGASEALRVGDLILLWIHQSMQHNAGANTHNLPYGSASTSGADAGRGWTNLNHTGKFQWLRVSGVGGGTSPQGTLVKAAGDTGTTTITVSNGGGGGPFGQLQLALNTVRGAQVVRVPQYGNATITGTVTAMPYQQTQTTGSNGPQGTGGIVALDVAGTLTFSPGSSINVDAMGFRGGAGQALTGSTGSSPAMDQATRFYAFSPNSGSPLRAFGGTKGEGAAGTPYRVYDSRTATITAGLNYSGAPSTVSADGYGVTAGGNGRGAPGNAGGGATDQCPFNGAGPSSTFQTMCRAGTVTYNNNRLNTGGGGGGGHGNGGKGGEQDFDGTRSGANVTSGGVQSYVGPIGYGGGGLGGKGVSSATLYAPENQPPTPAGSHQVALMGGGGGAGSTNDTINFANSSGGNGGGAVLIRSGRVAGSGSISANGGDAPDALTEDGGGGGGAGGWILVSARQTSTASLSMSARGGAGGDSSAPGNIGMGAGGGGGGGYIGTSTTLSAPSSSGVQGGAAGTTYGVKPPRSTSMATENLHDSVAASPAEAGSNGSVGQFPATGLSVPSLNAAAGSESSSSSSVAPGPQCVPILTKEFSSDGGTTWASTITRPKNGVFKMRITIENGNEDNFVSGSSTPQLYEDITLTDNYPANVVNATPPGVTQTGCGAVSIVATAGGSSLTIPTSGSIVSLGKCIITVDLKATAFGTWTNTIAAETVTVTQLKQIVGAANALTLENYEDVSATVIVPTMVEAEKTSTVVSDPTNGTTNPKRIPGAVVDYLLTITNPTATTLDNNSMFVADLLPPEVNLFVGNLTGGAPFEFTANGSNLTCGFGALGDGGDCVEFSTNGTDWTYTPMPDANGYDPAVRHIRFKPPGSMAANNTSFVVRYRVVVK